MGRRTGHVTHRVHRGIAISRDDGGYPHQINGCNIPEAAKTSILWGIMDQWSEGHLGLFEALAEICERVGNDDAKGRSQLTSPAPIIPSVLTVHYSKTLHSRSRSEVADHLSMDSESFSKRQT